MACDHCEIKKLKRHAREKGQDWRVLFVDKVAYVCLRRVTQEQMRKSPALQGTYEKHKLSGQDLYCACPPQPFKLSGPSQPTQRRTP